MDPSSFFRSESTSLPGLAEGESSGAQGLSGTPGSTDTNPIGDATKDTADVTGKATTLATTTGGVEDKVKAAEDAKALVTNLEAALKQAQDLEANTNDQNVKAALQGQIAQLQGSLTTAKLDATKKDAAAKSTPTTPATTTTGGGGTTTTPAGGGGGLQFPTPEEKKKYDTAQKDVADLKSQLEKAKESVAKAEALKKAGKPLPIAEQNALKKNVADLETKLTTAQKKADDIKKNAIPPTQKGPNKKNFNDNNDRKIVKFVDRTKVIYRDNDDNTDKEYIIIGNKNTCPTQSETVALNGQIKPKGIRILADFDPCRISDGSVTLNMPNTGSIKLALLFIDSTGNNNAGVLVKPLKIQDLSTNQALFTVELDSNMNGINPLSGQSTSISRINGLALYNDGNEPIQLNSGNMAALTATFTK